MLDFDSKGAVRVKNAQSNVSALSDCIESSVSHNIEPIRGSASVIDIVIARFSQASENIVI